MKERFLGLKKEDVDRVLRKKEREYQFQLEKLEFELQSTLKENEQLQNQIREEETTQLSLSKNDPYWRLAGTRIQTVLTMLRHQKVNEITRLTEASNEKIIQLQQEIRQLDDEIQSTNQMINKFWSSIRELEA
jgi:chromosome segregation ATPase